MAIGLRTLVLLLFLTGSFAAARADDRLLRLAVPDRLVESGLMKYLLPRFSLKSQIRVAVVAPGEAAEAVIGPRGTAIFAAKGVTWHLEVVAREHLGAARFADWITAEAGQRAITGFRVDGRQPFTLPARDAAEQEEKVYAGDALRGREIAHRLCGRCHVAVARQSGFGIGSTPSFFALRSFDDWSERFAIFYVLRPHPAFTQIEGVTPSFPEDRPAPIAPLSLTLEDLDALMAYVAGLEPVDLGAAIGTQ